MKNNKQYTFFWKDGSPFSQWNRTSFESEGITFKTAEHYMMYKKAELFGDTENMQNAIDAGHPREAKAVGRAVRNFDKAVWEANARNIVYKGNFCKFIQNDKIKDELLKTEGTRLVEASPYDAIWGIGMNEADARKAWSEDDWKGTNWLGEVLDAVREDIRFGKYRPDRFLNTEDND